MVKEVKIKANLESEGTLSTIIEYSKLAQNIEDIAKTIVNETGGVKNIAISDDMSQKYNVAKWSYLAVIMQGFYEKGLKDAKI